MAQSNDTLRPRGGYKDLREYLDALEAEGLLKRVSAEVDLQHEIGAISSRLLARNGPAVLFENIKDYPGLPLATNLMSTPELLGVIFDTDADDAKIYERAMVGMEKRLPSVTVPTGPCKEEIHYEGDVALYQFPTPFWHEVDGGQYIGTQAGEILLPVPRHWRW